MLAEPLTPVEDTSDNKPGSTGKAVAPARYKPESPFIPEPAYEFDGSLNAPSLRIANSSSGYSDEVESPFLSEYTLENGDVESMDASLHREIMEEIYDEEFEGAIEDLINQLKGVNEDRFHGEVGHSSAAAEEQMWMYYNQETYQVGLSWRRHKYSLFLRVHCYYP